MTQSEFVKNNGIWEKVTKLRKDLWTPEEIEILSQEYPKAHSVREVMESLPGRSRNAITCKAWRLGLSLILPFFFVVRYDRDLIASGLVAEGLEAVSND